VAAFERARIRMDVNKGKPDYRHEPLRPRGTSTLPDMTDGEAIARERIAREATERTGSLDLGELGLTILPEELFALKHLRRLNLGASWAFDESAELKRNSEGIALNDIGPSFLHRQLIELPESTGITPNDIEPSLHQLIELPELEELSLVECRLASLNGISALQTLRHVDCSFTQVSDLEPLSGLIALQDLMCVDTQVSDLEPLAKLTALQQLSCSFSQVSNLEPLSRLAALRWLDFSCTEVSNLEPLSGLTALQLLVCSYTQVRDLAPLSGLTALKWLDCSATKVRSLRPLSSLSALRLLWCYGTKVSNLSPLARLTALQELDCSACSLINFPQKILFRPSLKRLVLYNCHLPDVPAAVLSQSIDDNCLERLRAHVRHLHVGAALVADVKLMARAFRNSNSHEQGELVVEELSPSCVQVFYVPPREKVKQSGLDPDKIAEYRVKLLLINGKDSCLTIFPTNTLGGHYKFLKPKHHKVERITLAKYFSIEDPVPATRDEIMEMLETLPLGFTKDYDFGLGLAKDYRFIVEAVEELSDCTEIVISSKETGIDGERNIFFMSAADFERARRALNSIGNIGRSAARSVKDATAYNILAEKIGRPSKPVKAGRHPLRKLITAVAQGDEPLAENEQEAVLGILSRNTKAIAEAKPEKLAKLQSDIELVTLQILIERYEEMIGKKLKEESWQAFFHENPFVLNLAFGYPVIKVQDQASVGGRKLSGSGEKITDFLVKNSLTNNTAIFEIKTPQADLLNKTEFRNGVYTPSAELSGSINQALDQKYQFEGQIAHIKNNSRIYDIESYSVHCCLIIGTMPSGYDQLKSFELFRRNSKDVEIFTFDELLEKLKQLRDFLAVEETEPAEQQIIDTQDEGN
jgi:Leucine-rich repeat (LRR) protein